MMSSAPRAAIEEAASFIKSRTKHIPLVVITTGTGLAGLADQVTESDSIPYGDIPGFPKSTVDGHPGVLVFGSFAGRAVAIQRGRSHFYEGYSVAQVTLPIRVLRSLGAKVLIVTNAAGGINQHYQAGDIMLIADHIGLPSMAGNSPLNGPNDDTLGPRFPLMAGAYDRVLRQIAKRIAGENGFGVQEGVYAWVAGPAFESPAEIRFLRAVGADAVGMSTVPEVIVARHGGMRILGLSLITNIAADHEPAGDGPAEVHQEVMEASRRAVPRLTTIIKGVLEEMSI